MQCEVVYALPQEQQCITVDLSGGITTIRQAIQQSGILQLYPELSLQGLSVGIYGEHKTLACRVEDGDRIEIYRPLTLSPIEARRIRAERKRQSGQTGKFGA